jgi:glycosyltransferase involved in cell wall biosynthesis
VTPDWTILIATLGRRKGSLERLLSGLMPQVDTARGRVTVEALWNNGERSIAQVRQDLLAHAEARYVCFIDDDDEVPPYYVEKALAHMDGVDYIGFKVQVGELDSRGPVLAYHSLRYDGWHQDFHGYYRHVTHLNPVRRELVADVSYVAETAHYGEDHSWSDRAYPLLETEFFIDEVMYYYHAASGESLLAHLGGGMDFGRGYSRLRVASPHFSWHPASSPEER